jgi:ATP-binding cassette, subfamily B, multidrug efflux pump
VIGKTFPMFGAVQQRLDALNTVLQENLAGIRVVRAFARGDHELQRFGQANDRLMLQTTLAVQASAVTMPAMMLFLNVGVVAVIWLGGGAVQAGGMQVGQLVAFINYLTQTLMSLMMIGMLVMRFARSEASAERIGEVLVQQPDLESPQAMMLPQTLRGRIAFERVSFSYYPDGRDPVLRDVSFDVEPGQTVALLGATGAGKTSLVNLIPRFYDVNAGRILIDGVDVRQIDEAQLHGQVGVVLQESILFSGTIRDNIRYGRPTAGDDEVVAAAQMAQAHDFISRLPEGYDSVVGQRGVNLSGGQKQRLAIARALLVQPAIIVLDDSTSAVDLATEALIQSALATLPQRPTRVVVAQRISSVLSADKILVIDDGQVVAEGNHATLIEQSPIYREIYHSQIDQSVIVHD